MSGKFVTTTSWPTTPRKDDQSLLNRLDLISVAILGVVIAICTMICCFVGLRRRKVLPNESQTVDVQHNDDSNQGNAFGVELRNPHGAAVQRLPGELRAPDSPPPTYSILERQTSFTSQISQSSSQIEVPPNYEEAAGLGRQSLMSTLIPEESTTVIKMVAKDRPYHRSESAHQSQPLRPTRTNRSKSDIGRSRWNRAPRESEPAFVTLADVLATCEGNSSSLPPDFSKQHNITTGSTEPLLTSPKTQSPHKDLPASISSQQQSTPTRDSIKKVLNRLSTDV